VKVFPLIFKTIMTGVKELKTGFIKRTHLIRTDRDISMAWVLIGSVTIILFLWLYPGMPMNFLTIFACRPTLIGAGLGGFWGNGMSKED